MPNCKLCGKAVTSARVMHTQCSMLKSVIHSVPARQTAFLTAKNWLNASR